MREITRNFGAERHLVATFTEPVATPALHGVMALFTNAGVISRIGPHRINVTLARRLAALGLRSMRWDLSGLGDSGRPERPLPLREQFVADTRAAMDEAQRQYGADRFLMVGFCSGAEVAYYTALHDDRLAALVLFDLFVYPTWKTQAIRIARRVRKHGMIDAVRRIGRAVVRGCVRALARRRRAADAQAAARKPSRAEFATRLARLHARGTRVLILYAGELDTYNYERQFHDRFRRFGIVDKIDCAYLRQSDHVFTTARAQQALLSTVVPWTEAWLAAATARTGTAPEHESIPSNARPKFVGDGIGCEETPSPDAPAPCTGDRHAAG